MPEWVWGLVLMAVSVLVFVGIMALAWFSAMCWLDSGVIIWTGCWGRG